MSDGPFTAEDVEHVVVYLRDGEGYDEGARIVEALRDLLRGLVSELEGCDLTGPDEAALAPLVERARRVIDV